MNSKWFNQCVEARTAQDLVEKKAAAKEARKKLIVLPIVFTIMCGVMILAMMNNPNGNTSGVPVIGVIYVVLMLMSILLIAKKKGAPTSLDRFKEAIQKYVNTPELQAALDEEMTSEPIGSYEKKGFYVTKNFFYREFTDGSRMVYPCSAIKTAKWAKDAGDYQCEFYDASRKFLMGIMCSKAEQAEVNAFVEQYLPNVKRK